MRRLAFYIAGLVCTILLVQYLWNEHKVLFVLALLSFLAFIYFRRKEKSPIPITQNAEPDDPASIEEEKKETPVVIETSQDVPAEEKPQRETVSPTLASWVYDEQVPKEVAEGLIKKSTWWLTHRHGPVQAPNHYKRIFLSKSHGWSIEFGANTFLVGKAIQRCKNILREVEKDFSCGKRTEEKEIKDRLINAISGAVANSSGVEYYGYPVNESGEMVFGAQAIDVNQASTYIIWTSAMSQILANHR